MFNQGNINYNIRHGSESLLQKMKTTFFGDEFIAYLGSKLWKLLSKGLNE